MKKYFNKLLALVIATVIILTFSAVPAFASGSSVPQLTLSSEDARPTLRTITVKNIGATGAIVRAYQIVKGTYKDGKLTGYELCDSTNAHLEDITKPRSSEIVTIANNIRSGTASLASVQMAYSSGDYIANVEAGEYIILLIQNSRYDTDSCYNPAVVSVSVTDANLLTASDDNLLDMNSQFSAYDTAYMKSSKASISKKIVIDDNTYVTANAASFGDAVNFRVSTNIPSYSDYYLSPLIVRIIDDLYSDRSADPPFLGVNGLTVKVDGSEVPEVTGEGAEAVRNYTVKYYKKNESTTGEQIVRTQDPSEAVYYEIEFADAFIRANGTKNVEVTYSSTLTTNAKIANVYRRIMTPNLSGTAARIECSKDPSNPSDLIINSASAYTRTYTFGIDSGENGIQTYELNKVNQAGGTYIPIYDDNNYETTKYSQYALAGATFTIYSDRAMTDVIESAGTATTPPDGTSISDENGHIEFRGLGPGTYYIKETSAPSDYTLNENDYKIVISAETDGSRLTSYKIEIYLMGDTDRMLGRSGARLVSNRFLDPITTTPAEIVNTQLATLPTTGGVGTIVISVVAGLGMAVFLTIFVISKKRSSKKTKIKS